MFKRHDRILSGLLLCGLRERELSIQVQRSIRIRYPASSLPVTCFWSTGSLSRQKPTRSEGRILLDSTATEQEDSSVSSDA